MAQSHPRQRTLSDSNIGLVDESRNAPARWEQQMEQLFDELANDQVQIPQELRNAVSSDGSVRGGNLFRTLFCNENAAQSVDEQSNLGWKTREDAVLLDQEGFKFIPRVANHSVNATEVDQCDRRRRQFDTFHLQPMLGDAMSPALNLKVRKAFTHFHNQQGGNSANVFLGDESSVRKGSSFRPRICKSRRKLSKTRSKGRTKNNHDSGEIDSTEFILKSVGESVADKSVVTRRIKSADELGLTNISDETGFIAKAIDGTEKSLDLNGTVTMSIDQVGRAVNSIDQVGRAVNSIDGRATKSFSDQIPRIESECPTTADPTMQPRPETQTPDDEYNLSASYAASNCHTQYTNTTNFPLAPLSESSGSIIMTSESSNSSIEEANAAQKLELHSSFHGNQDDMTSIPYSFRRTSLPANIKPFREHGGYYHPGTDSVLPAVPSYKLEPHTQTRWFLPHIMAQANSDHALQRPELARALFRRGDAHCFQLLCRPSPNRDSTSPRTRDEYDAIGWTLRWILVRHNFLSEYRGRTRLVPIGMVNLSGARIKQGTGKCENHLTLYLPEASYNVHASQSFDFKCADIEECMAFITVIQRASSLRVDDVYSTNHATQNLGSGRFASILEVKRLSDGQKTAIKLVDKSAFWHMVRDGKERPDTLVREITAQALLSVLASQHPETPGASGLVPLHDVVETRTHIALEMQLMKGGDLFQVLDKQTVLTEPEAGSLIADLLRAVFFMKCHGVAHRDIKLANVIFDKEGNDRVLKVADFGMAAFVGTDGMLRGRCGTPGYVAPEILRAGPNEPYLNNVDVFSTGVVLYILLCGYEPFYGSNERRLISANKKCVWEFHNPEWINISDGAKDLIAKLLDPNPVTRLTPAQALAHPWVELHSTPLQTKQCNKPTISMNRGKQQSNRTQQSLTHPLDPTDPTVEPVETHSQVEENPVYQSSNHSDHRTMGPRRRTWHHNHARHQNRKVCSSSPHVKESNCTVS